MSEPDPNRDKETNELTEVRDLFVAEWGAMGNAWGVNRTMAQIHSLLLTSPNALTTDDVMSELRISRGNAHSNLRELVGWGLIKSVIRKGERKEYFEAEKDVWRIFCIVVRERKRREVEPALKVLKECEEKSAKMKSAEAREFHKQIKALGEFVALADSVMDRIARAERSQVMPMLAKFMR
jgi:DNA-binding transcriptional regulator GbsR (MarR family)